MSKEYFRNPSMINGGPFRCLNCNKYLALKVTGSVFEIAFKCPRCKAEINMKCNEAIPCKTNIFKFIKSIIKNILDSVEFNKNNELQEIKNKLINVIKENK